MIYILAIFLPPVAVLLRGKPTQVLINLFLCIFYFVPGIIHALLVVKNSKGNTLTKRSFFVTCKILISFFVFYYALGLEHSHPIIGKCIIIVNFFWLVKTLTKEKQSNTTMLTKKFVSEDVMQ